MSNELQIMECLEDHEYHTTSNPQPIRFRISVGEDGYKEVMAYNDVLERLEADQENPTVWKFKQIVGHQGPLRPTDPTYMESSYNVTMEWENVEITLEPPGIIAKDSPVACAIYARDNLLDLPDWKRFKSIAKNQKKLLRLVNQAKLRSFCTAKKLCMDTRYRRTTTMPFALIDSMAMPNGKTAQNSKWIN